MDVVVVETAKTVTVVGVVPRGNFEVHPAAAAVVKATGVALARRTAARDEGTADIPVAVRAASIQADMLAAQPRMLSPTIRREKTLEHLPRTSRLCCLQRDLARSWPG